MNSIFPDDSNDPKIIHLCEQATSLLMDQSYVENLDVSMKHSDQSHIVSVSNTTLQYFWTPFSGNITHKLQQIKDGEFEIIIMGAAVWDALHTRSVTRYSESLEEISETLSKLGQKDQKVIFLRTRATCLAQIFSPSR